MAWRQVPHCEDATKFTLGDWEGSGFSAHFARGSAALAQPAAMSKSFAVAMPGPSFQCDPKQKERKTLEMSEWGKLCEGASPQPLLAGAE